MYLILYNKLLSTISQRMQEERIDSFINLIREQTDELGEQNDVWFGDSIKYTLTKNSETMDGFLNSGEQNEYDFGSSLKLKIEWNDCQSVNSGKQQGRMTINNISMPTDTGGECTSSEIAVYNDSHQITAQVLSISSEDAPFHYRISREDGKLITGNEWNLSVSFSSDGEDIFIDEIFH